MSGTIGSILGRADAAASLLFGGGTLTLGGVPFTDWAIPEKMPWGGQHQLTVHKLPGGRRVIDAMGWDDAPLAWSGLFLGPTATDDARAVATLKDAGDPIPLIWGDFSYTVVIGEFCADYQDNGFRIPYRISCVVQQDDARTPTVSQGSWLDGIKSDVNEALGFDVFAAGSQALGMAQKAVGVAAALSGGSPALVSLQSSVGLVSGGVTLGSAALATASKLATGASSVLTSISTAADKVLAGGVSSASDLTAATGAAGAGAQATAAGGYVGRAGVNLADGRA